MPNIPHNGHNLSGANSHAFAADPVPSIVVGPAETGNAQPSHPPGARPGPDGHGRSPTLEPTFADPVRPGHGRPPHDADFFALDSRALLEQHTGKVLGPRSPAGKVEMTRGQAAAAQMFKANLDASDPSCILRTQGEFTQAFGCREENMYALGPMHYGPANALSKPVGRDGATCFIHSRPSASGASADFPTGQDYLIAHKRSHGNTNGLEGHMLYHHAADKFYGYQGKVNPKTQLPEFHELENPFDMGPSQRGRESLRSLPDQESWGQHLINWPGR